MGIDLVEGRDLVVSDGFVYMRTTKGFERIDVLYRRIDDDFLDPQAFREDSMLGVPGLMDAYRAGRIALANAPGTGIADDKVVYAYVPQIIKYYLERRRDHSERADVRLLGRHAAEPRAGEPRQAGGEAGQRVGRLRPDDRPAGQRRRSGPRVREQIRANPRNYIAQPMLSLSRVPVLTDDGLEGRHVDLRPFIVYGRDDVTCCPAG